MAEKRLTHTITVDLAKETWSSRPVLVQNSDNTFLITVLNDGEPADLSDVRDIVLAAIPSRKKANDSVFSTGVKVGSTSQVKIDLGRAAVATPGIVQAQLKLTGINGGLISSTSFNFEVQMDAGLNFQPSENELTLIETVLGDGPTVLANAEQTIADMESTQATLTGAVGGAISSLNEDKAAAIEEMDTAKTTALNELAEVREANRFRQLDAVATVVDRDTTYPNPEHGDTVRVTSTATMYKYDKDAGWVVSDRYEATAVDALNQQLADTESEIKAQFATAAKASMLDDFELDGAYSTELSLPSDFPHTLPFKLYRHNDDTISHTFNIESYKSGAGQIYLDYMTGVDTNDGGSPEAPKKTMKAALEAAEAMTQSSVVINLMNKYFVRNYMGIIAQGASYTLKKNIIFSPYGRDRTFIGNFENPSAMSWVADGTAYKATRGAVNNVFDLSTPDEKGEPTRYRQVGSVAEVQAEEGTWFQEGSTVWVRRIGDLAIDEDIMVAISMAGVEFIANDRKFVFDRTSWWWGAYYDRDDFSPDGLRVTGNANTELVLYRGSYAYADNNGVATVRVGKVYNVESLAYDNGTDGFNYHGTKVVNPYEFVYEFNVEAFRNGKNGVGNNNGSTGHEGMSIVRVNTVAYECDGPLIADVNGCYSVLFNCMGHSSTKLTKGNTKAGLFFNNSSSVKNGKVVLVNCAGGGENTYSLSTDGLIEVVIVEKFRGRDIYTPTFNSLDFSYDVANA